MRMSSRSGLILVQMITLMTLMSGLADSHLYKWEAETGVATYSNDPTLAPDGVQVKVLLDRSSGQEASEILVTGAAWEKPAAEPSTVITQGEFAVHLARELGFGQDLTSEEAIRVLSDVPIVPPLGHWERDAAMTPALVSRLRAVTVAAPQVGWISVTPEEAGHAFDSAAALLGVPIPVDRDTEVPRASPPEVEQVPHPGVITQGEFAVHLARELGLGQDLTPEEAAGILSDLRIAPPLGHWERDAAMTPALTSRLRALTVAAPQMGWIAITPEEALFAFDTAAALLGVPIPVDLDTEVRESSPPAVAVPALVYVTPPPYLIAPYYTWIPVSGGFLWHGTTVHGFFALHSVHLNTHHFNGHRFAFGLHFVRRHFPLHLTEHHLVRRHLIHRPLRHSVRHFTRSFARPSHRIRHRHRDLRHHLHSRRFDRHGIHDRRHVIRHRTARHNLLARRIIPSAPRILTAPHTNTRHHASLQRHSRRGRHRSGSGRFRRR
ncbi:MAG: DUF4124 domain-containing protein [Nitrospiria bacterium]